MPGINCNGSRALTGWGFVALWAMLMAGLGAIAWSSEAMALTGQPLAYVANQYDGTNGSVSVIDTGNNTVVDTIQLIGNCAGIAVAPDGRHIYVADPLSQTVQVIETVNETNRLVATVLLSGSPTYVAVTPDGKRVYVANFVSNTVSVIDTTSNTVVGNPIPVGNGPHGFAVTPDGKSVYVVNLYSGTVSVIDTASNMVVGNPILVGSLFYPAALHRHAGRETRLRREFRCQQRFGDRYGQQHGGGEPYPRGKYTL